MIKIGLKHNSFIYIHQFRIQWFIAIQLHKKYVFIFISSWICLCVCLSVYLIWFFGDLIVSYSCDDQLIHSFSLGSFEPRYKSNDMRATIWERKTLDFNVKVNPLICPLILLSFYFIFMFLSFLLLEFLQRFFLVNFFSFS